MLVYHGSYSEIQKPNLSFGRYNLDFGRGFYVTTLKKQAEKWAMRRAMIEGKKPIINIYELDLQGLTVLSFDGYSETWLDFIVENRSGMLKSHGYDAIFGNIADDDVATIVNDYMRLLRKGRISPMGKQFYLEQIRYSKPNDQYCLATQRAIEALAFKEALYV